MLTSDPASRGEPDATGVRSGGARDEARMPLAESSGEDRRVGAAEAGKPIRVHHFLRAPVPGWFSIERQFEDVREHLPSDILATVVVNRRSSRGSLPRLLDALEARRRQGDVNHILGDVHYLAWFLRRSTTLITVHDCVSLERLTGWRRWLLWLLWYWWPLKRAGLVSVNSHFSRNALLRWVSYPAERITVIPPPLSPEFTLSPPRPHAEWSRLLQIGFTPNKNQLRLIEAIAGLDVVLVTIGALSDDVKAAIARHRIRHEGYEQLERSELLKQYHQADILVFPSTYEGFGMPIVEAQAVGRPVVTSRVDPMPETAGGAACLVDPLDISSIRAGIRRVLDDEAYAQRLIKEGFENAARYSIETITAQYASLYRRLAESGSERHRKLADAES